MRPEHDPPWGARPHPQHQRVSGAPGVHDRADDGDPGSPERGPPPSLVLSLRTLAGRVGRDVRAHGGERADHPRVRRRTLTVELRSANSVPFAALTELFNRAYEGYVIPFRLDEALLRFMVETYDLDLDASRVAFDGDEAVGLGNLGLRGEDAWIGGVGVVTSARRQGIGETLMRALHAEARERGVRNVWLEVIDRNESAYELYVKLGYRVVRELEVWSLAAAGDGGAAREVPAAEARARVRELREGREPWQRADATLDNLDDLHGLVTDDGAAVFRGTSAVQLLQIAGGGTDELLRTLRGFGYVSVLNLPDDDPAADALRVLGAAPAVRQREMVLEL